MVEVVNVVGSGALAVELDLSAVAQELGGLADYDPDKYPGLYLRLGESRPLVTLYRTGKYIITGASSETEATATREELLSILTIIIYSKPPMMTGSPSRTTSAWLMLARS